MFHFAMRLLYLNYSLFFKKVILLVERLWYKYSNDIQSLSSLFYSLSPIISYRSLKKPQLTPKYELNMDLIWYP